MKRFRRILSMALSLAMILTIIPWISLGTSAADIIDSGKCGDNLTWMLDSEGTLTISGEGEMWDFYYYTDRPWINYCDDIVKSIICDGVTNIGNDAFLECSSLTSVAIPNGVTSI